MADQKITQLTSTDATASTDIIAFVDDPGGTPVTKARGIAEFITDQQAGDTDMQELTSQTLIVTPYALAIAGSSDFPASPETGQRHFRTDLGFDCYYDGTRWLTTFIIPSNTADRSGISAAEERIMVVTTPDYDVYAIAVHLNTYVSTTNNSSDYWTIEVQGQSLDRASESVFFTVNTAADSANTWVDHSGPSTDPSPTNQTTLIADVAKTGTPGNLDYTVKVCYRYIIT